MNSPRHDLNLIVRLCLNGITSKHHVQLRFVIDPATGASSIEEIENDSSGLIDVSQESDEERNRRLNPTPDELKRLEDNRTAEATYGYMDD